LIIHSFKFLKIEPALEELTVQILTSMSLAGLSVSTYLDMIGLLARCFNSKSLISSLVY